ncbi:undecaprenyl-phosphate glucose phosphotransferase [Tenacibaculum sp. E3R01]|uniref:exopolysaccharide biosynthesis polyprenyl glycosylphosphotransferase n=1 Tax=unclassified Tenacibaculum TaxID=2635139 RepID=UPI00089C38AE|nr:MULTISPECIES: exopolysaccharide biosynthesis polyprenyl glycosylphosphotransferase [unclassified Tenacibaculum]RBW59605.1 undecaprenyl-phosphate glucose phosphotransferase [Tenacibaculum sp. E3R01]SED97546.1 putative colanic acid biosysnthesis UDP-glucose lipid carrier transferase [Tenacibaculum sp. MAR_2010_89]
MGKRYSKYINSLFLLNDILIINLVVFLINDQQYLQIHFLGYASLFWILSSLFTGFYNVYRFTSLFKVLSLIIIQLSIFTLGYFSYFSIFREGEIVNNQANVLLTIFLSITIFKFLGIFLLKKYRTYGKNYRKVIVLGYDSSAKKLINLFKKDKELGYEYCGFFSDESQGSNEHIGTIESSLKYVIKNQIDEIYCSLTELTEKQVKKITKFATKKNRVVKLIPNANELYNKNTTSEYYGGSTVVLKVKKMPFELIENRIIKRSFDIVFSLLICLFVMSWLYPLLFILIKFESKGPVVFKQKREGLYGGEFVCYKFRSMRINSMADKIHTSKNDTRITKVGAFLRKTSLDEFPQFFNVLLGSMSVVGPRPHMNEQSFKFTKEVRNYMKRKSVKPGITGLAQVSGYRGEITNRIDIENRVRFDIFYIENWSLMLDVKIIFQTVFNVFKGEDKAY